MQLFCYAFYQAGYVIVAQTNEIFPITTYFDHEGVECDTLEEACSLVAGPGPRGGWITLPILTKGEPTRH